MSEAKQETSQAPDQSVALSPCVCGGLPSINKRGGGRYLELSCSGCKLSYLNDECGESTIDSWNNAKSELDKHVESMKCEWMLAEHDRCERCDGGETSGQAYFISDGGYEPRDGTYVCIQCLWKFFLGV